MKRFCKYTSPVLIAAILVFSCTTIKYVPVETIKEVSVHDTTYLHRTDTLVQVPDVSISDFIDLKDTLIMRGTLSEARAWVDSTAMMLKGRLVQTGKMPVQIVEKERIIYRDSTSQVEVPVPVEVTKEVVKIPWLYRLFAGIGIIALGLLFGWGLGKYLHRW